MTIISLLHRTFCAILFFLFFQQTLFSFTLPPNIMSIQAYRLKREKEKIAQYGQIYGLKLSYDYIKRYKFYAGIEGFYGIGTLHGHKEEIKLRSHFTDRFLEGRIGYTFQSKGATPFIFVPFIGYGYLQENTHFKKPKKLPVHFSIACSYVPIGFFSSYFLSSDFSIGFNFKARFIINGKQKVTHDPQFKDSTQHFVENTQFCFEIPLNYFFCWREYFLAIGIVPFYEYRHYGKRVNYPFDFLDTTLKLYGGRLQCLFLF